MNKIISAAVAALLALATASHVNAARVRVHSQKQGPPPAFELPASFDGNQLPINYASPAVQQQAQAQQQQPLVVGAEKTASTAESGFIPGAAAPAGAPAGASAFGGPPQGMPPIPEDYQLMWAPTVPPRLSDDRMRNYSPVESAAQKILRKEGEVPEPEKDCVKTP